MHFGLWNRQQKVVKKNIVVDYFNGANSGKNNWYGRTSYFLTGYTCKKYVHPRDAKSGTDAKVIDKKIPVDSLCRGIAILCRSIK